MQAYIEKTVQITLVLTQKEAEWLACYVQNAQCDPLDEPPTDSHMREVLFYTLQQELQR